MPNTISAINAQFVAALTLIVLATVLGLSADRVDGRTFVAAVTIMGAGAWALHIKHAAAAAASHQREDDL